MKCGHVCVIGDACDDVDLVGGEADDERAKACSMNRRRGNAGGVEFISEELLCQNVLNSDGRGLS